MKGKVKGMKKEIEITTEMMKFDYVPVGGLFKFENAVFVCMPIMLQIRADAYPSVCISSNSNVFSIGKSYYFNEEAEVEYVYPQGLAD